MRLHITRRDALKATAAMSAGLFLGAKRRRAYAAGPHDRLNVACIGVGGRGATNVLGVAGQNFLAFADVDDKRAAVSYKKYPDVKRYRDYRRMFDELGHKLDAVVISTPDHMHFHPAYAAMQLGLHVYLEKPLAHNVWEIRTLTELAREKKLATQLGAQRHALKNMHRVVELVQSGAIGPVTEVHSWVQGGRGMPAMAAKPVPVPATLDYDLWVGAAEPRPYDPVTCPYGWRFWWQFGTGETGNWGCHVLDIPFWALDLKHPQRVDATGPAVDPLRTPKTMHVTFQFAGRGTQPPVTLHWYQGAPEILKKLGLSGARQNNLFIGKEGMLLCGFDKRQLLPKEKFAHAKPPQETIPDSPGFYSEWIAACRGGKPATCNFDYGGPLAETVILGNVAYRAGGFDWDAAGLKTPGNDKAQSLLREAFRKGWEM